MSSLVYIHLELALCYIKYMEKPKKAWQKSKNISELNKSKYGHSMPGKMSGKGNSAKMMRNRKPSV